VIHMFREYGNSILITTDYEPISFQIHNYAWLVLRVEEDIEFRLVVQKCRSRPVIESPLIAFFREEFPSIEIARFMYPEDPNLDGEVNDYVVFKDAVDAVHFKLKYC
jgi:hypothetical protein